MTKEQERAWWAEYRRKNRDHLRKKHSEWRAAHPEKEKLYRERSRDKRKKYQAEWYQKNKRRIAAQRRKWGALHTEERKAQQRKHYLKYRDAIKARVERWRKNNKALVNAYSRSWRLQNHDKRLQICRRHNRKACDTLTNGYLNALLSRRGFDPATIPTDVKDVFREVLKLKREIRSVNKQHV